MAPNPIKSQGFARTADRSSVPNCPGLRPRPTLLRGLGFRGCFSDDFGRRSNVHGPKSGSKLPGPPARTIVDRISVRSHKVCGPKSAKHRCNRTQDEVVITPGGPGWSPTAEVGLNTLLPTEIQGSGAIRGSIPVVLNAFPGVLRGGSYFEIRDRRSSICFLGVGVEAAAVLPRTQEQGWGLRLPTPSLCFRASG